MIMTVIDDNRTLVTWSLIRRDGDNDGHSSDAHEGEDAVGLSQWGVVWCARDTDRKRAFGPVA